MQVYNTYFKIIKKRLPSILLYFVVFLLIVIIIASQMSSTPTAAFTQTKSTIAYFNQDKSSPLTAGLREYLSQNATIIELPDNTEDISDALFFSKISYVVRIPAGFTQSFLSGNGDVHIITMSSSSQNDSVFMDMLINRYLNTADFYNKNIPAISESAIAQNVGRDLSISTDMQLNTFNKKESAGNVSYYFQFLAYAILAVLIMGITTIMMAFNETNLHNRNACSPLPSLKMNLQMFAANITFSLVVWAASCSLVFLIYKDVSLNLPFLLLSLNALVFTFASLSIGFLAGKFIKSAGVQSAITNLISLGVCFLSGVFVEQEWLGKTVLTIASFTPGYWYIKAVNDIRDLTVFNSASITPVVYSMLIQLGFSAAILCLALALSKQKKSASISNQPTY